MRPGVNLFQHRVVTRRVEMRRFDQYSVDVRDAVSSLRGKPLRHGPARRDHRRGIRFLQRANQRAIAAAPQFQHGCQIDARPSIHEILAVRGELDDVVPVALRELSEAGAVELNPAELPEVRVFALAQTLRHEPDRACRLVQAGDFAHAPIPLRHGVLQRARRHIDQVKLCPAGTLAHPEQSIRFREPAALRFGHVVDEGPRGFLYDCPHAPGPGVDGEDAIELVSALIVVEVKFLSRGCPLHGQVPVWSEGIRKEIVGNPVRTALIQPEQHRLHPGQLISRLQVIDRPNLGLKLAGGGRFHQRQLPPGHPVHRRHHEAGPIGRPNDRTLVRFGFAAIRRQHRGCATGLIHQHDLILLEAHLPAAIRRSVGVVVACVRIADRQRFRLPLEDAVRGVGPGGHVAQHAAARVGHQPDVIDISVVPRFLSWR